MKTTKQNIINRREILSFFLIVTSSFILLTGCQKDEMPQVSNTTNENQAIERLSNTSNENVIGKPFTVLEINHVAMFSALPDYKIQLMSDNKAIYIGRKNTAVLGQVQMDVNPKIAAQIRAMYIKANLLQMATLELNIDLPINTTTFRANLSSDLITRIDYNKGTLKELREKTEQLLNISNLVNLHRKLSDIQAVANDEHN